MNTYLVFHFIKSNKSLEATSTTTISSELKSHKVSRTDSRQELGYCFSLGINYELLIRVAL